MMDDHPYLSQCTFYEDSTSPKQSLILLDARDWYRSRSMIAGILAGVLLESTAMIILRKPALNSLYPILLGHQLLV
jgi:cation transporter-like permease